MALHFTSYAAGLPVAKIVASLRMDDIGYAAELQFHTIGLYSVLNHDRSTDLVRGFWQGGLPRPQHFESAGQFDGDQRLLTIDYPDGNPDPVQVVPPNDSERDEVAPAQRAGAVDMLSALVDVIRRQAASGACDDSMTTFDGRRLVQVTATSAGSAMLTVTSGDDRASWHGMAQRCDVTTRQLAGFPRAAHARASAMRPHHAIAWFAPVVAGLNLPVRISFQTDWVGFATLYLTQIDGLAGGAVAEGNHK